MQAQTTQNGAPRGAGARGTKAPSKMWEIVAVYEGGKRYLFRTRDLVRTLRKLISYKLGKILWVYNAEERRIVVY